MQNLSQDFKRLTAEKVEAEATILRLQAERDAQPNINLQDIKQAIGEGIASLKGGRKMKGEKRPREAPAEDDQDPEAAKEPKPKKARAKAPRKSRAAAADGPQPEEGAMAAYAQMPLEAWEAKYPVAASLKKKEAEAKRVRRRALMVSDWVALQLVEAKEAKPQAPPKTGYALFCKENEAKIDDLLANDPSPVYAQHRANATTVVGHTKKGEPKYKRSLKQARGPVGSTLWNELKASQQNEFNDRAAKDWTTYTNLLAEWEAAFPEVAAEEKKKAELKAQNKKKKVCVGLCL